MSQGTTIYTLKILQDHSDADHCLTQQQILNYLKEEYGIVAERKKIARDLERLDDAGFEIHKGENGKGCYLVRDFDDTELRFLIDYLISSRQIPMKYSQELIQKLFTLGGPSLQERYRAFCPSPQSEVPKNPNFFSDVGELADAIKDGKKVAFYYYQYGLDKQLHPIQSAKIIVNPSALVSLNGKYYLVAMPENVQENWQKSEKANFFRLDRMKEVQVLQINSSHAAKNLRDEDLEAFLKVHPFGSGSNITHVTVRIDSFLIDEFIDAFGTRFTPPGLFETEKVTISLKAGEEDILRWVLQHTPRAEIIEPEPLRSVIADRLKAAGALYEAPKEEPVQQSEALPATSNSNEDIVYNNGFLGICSACFDETDEAFFEQYKDAESIQLVQTERDDYSFLAKFPKLRKLHIEENELYPHDLSFLTELPNLESLYLFNIVRSNCKFPIYELPNLKYLDGCLDDFRNVDFRKLYQTNPDLQAFTEQGEYSLWGRVMIDQSWFERPGRAVILEGIVGEELMKGAPKAYYKWLDQQENFIEALKNATKELDYNERASLQGYAEGKSVQELSEELLLSCEAISHFLAYAPGRISPNNVKEYLEQFMPWKSPFAEIYEKKHKDRHAK